MLQRNQ